jgi:hypothetical protein
MEVLMKALNRLLALAVVFLPAAAWAASPLTTPPIAIVAGDQSQCAIVNVGTKPADIQIFMANDAGGTATFTQTVQPGDVGYGTVSWPSGIQVYCQVSGISKKSGRVRLCLLQGGRCTATVTAQ